MASEGSNQGTENQQTQQRNQTAGSQQQDAQQDTQQEGRQEQNLTEQEIADNAPVRKNDPRTSVQKAEEYRFASNIPGDQTIPEKEYADYTRSGGPGCR